MVDSIGNLERFLPSQSAFYIGHNNSGDIAFRVPSGDVVAANINGASLLIASRGERAPGTDTAWNTIDLKPVLLNDVGQIAFMGYSGKELEKGIWATDPTGQLQLVVHVGDVIEIAPGVSYRVSELANAMTPDQFNETGQLVFWARLGDQEGIFVGSLSPELADGDFDGDGQIGVADIDSLTKQISSESYHTWYDVNTDSHLNRDDRAYWIHNSANTFFGDANLDGEFNSGDLIAALAAGTYEADVDAGWASGDFDGSGRFDSGDLIFALADGGYEAGPRAAVAAVPEPSSFLLLCAGSRAR